MITRLGGVDDGAGSAHDADVVDAMLVAKEHQIPGQVLPVGHVMALMVLVLCRGDASNLLVGTLVDGELSQARAIEATVRFAPPATTTIDVRGANLVTSSVHDRSSVTVN